MLQELEASLEATGTSEIDRDNVQTRAQNTYRYDEPEAALVKWYLNFELSREAADQVVSGLFSKLVDDEAAWCERTYLSEDQIRELVARVASRDVSNS